jgi:phosphoglycerate dehydrogenase-like enzyme
MSYAYVMSQSLEHKAWTQWEDIRAPDGVTTLNPKNFPLEDSDLSQITFYVAPYMGGRKALEYTTSMSNLKILQVPNAGFDDALEFLRPGMILCNARGVHDASTAELAVALAISSRRGFYDFAIAQQSDQWQPKRYESFNDSKIGIIGAGSIARTLANYLSPYDVEVSFFSRSGSDGAIKIGDLDAHLPHLDILFLVLPLNAESKHLINVQRLKLMKDGAVIVNVGRGPIIDTEALINELNTGRIFAGLDVTDPEPLPQGHPLWSAKNLVLSPHVGGNSTAFDSRAKKLIERQLDLISRGVEPENIVARG